MWGICRSWLPACTTRAAAPSRRLRAARQTAIAVSRTVLVPYADPHALPLERSRSVGSHCTAATAYLSHAPCCAHWILFMLGLPLPVQSNPLVVAPCTRKYLLCSEWGLSLCRPTHIYPLLPMYTILCACGACVAELTAFAAPSWHQLLLSTPFWHCRSIALPSHPSCYLRSPTITAYSCCCSCLGSRCSGWQANWACLHVDNAPVSPAHHVFCTTASE